MTTSAGSGAWGAGYKSAASDWCNAVQGATQTLGSLDTGVQADLVAYFWRLHLLVFVPKAIVSGLRLFNGWPVYDSVTLGLAIFSDLVVSGFAGFIVVLATFPGTGAAGLSLGHVQAVWIWFTICLLFMLKGILMISMVGEQWSLSQWTGSDWQSGWQHRFLTLNAILIGLLIFVLNQDEHYMSCLLYCFAGLLFFIGASQGHVEPGLPRTFKSLAYLMACTLVLVGGSQMHTMATWYIRWTVTGDTVGWVLLFIWCLLGVEFLAVVLYHVAIAVLNGEANGSGPRGKSVSAVKHRQKVQDTVYYTGLVALGTVLLVVVILVAVGSTSMDGR